MIPKSQFGVLWIGTPWLRSSLVPMTRLWFRCSSVFLEKTFLISVRPWSTLRIWRNYEVGPQLNLCNQTHSKFVLESQGFKGPWDISTDSSQVRYSCIQLALLYKNKYLNVTWKQNVRREKEPNLWKSHSLLTEGRQWPKESLNWFQQDL